MSTVAGIENEPTATKTRVTKDGRRITYHMSVMQQPERARACGQGAKSSTDRRPVDPPPIVSLRILEGDEGNQTDITFAYRANFFVWASLENTRPIAHGRVQQTPSNTPVLCGSPVAGISYLDRPTAAGYFVFPDLSVRHEGKYRLAFTLYEELKDPKNEDGTEQECSVEGGTGEYVNGRCQVKSDPFTVHSAKKFPGLAESTALSRMVADQGCRVRIRRDVRMRRRDTKNSKDWDDYDSTGGDRRHSATPDTYHTPVVPAPPSGDPVDRPRSVSIASNASIQPQPSRRTSSHDTNQQYQQPYGQVPPPPHSYHQHYEPSMMTSYNPPQYPSQQHIAQSPQQHMTQFQPPYNFQQPQPVVPFPYNYGHMSQQPMHSPVYPSPASHMRHDNMNFVSSPQEYQSPSAAQYNPPGHMGSPVGTIERHYGRTTQPPSQMYSATSAGPPSHNQGPNGKVLPPLQTQDSQGSYDYSPQDSGPPPPPYSTGNTAGEKRSYRSVFPSSYLDKPLHSGQRPSTTGTTPPDYYNMSGGADSGSDEDSLDCEQLKMTYRRADGTQVRRLWPQAA